ncbi:hypothetical protein ACIOKD_02465 [Streptomyces sp. NPDC087844]|uniref:hypothetical protein n=1 Tax=Streptomyces sp. NPDC087844 TaxID=3365805 RepID=UPI00380A84F4
MALRHQAAVRRQQEAARTVAQPPVAIPPRPPVVRYPVDPVPRYPVARGSEALAAGPVVRYPIARGSEAFSAGPVVRYPVRAPAPAPSHAPAVPFGRPSVPLPSVTVPLPTAPPFLARRPALGHPVPRFVPLDASPCDTAAIVYQEEAAWFEAALARHIIDRRPEVARQMRTVACAAWHMVSAIDPARTSKFAETNRIQQGAVGDDPGALRRVAESGNLRETVAFLLAGERNGAFRGLSDFGSTGLLQQQRAKREKHPVKLQRRLARDVHPPLSADEKRFASSLTANGERYVEWCRGDQFITLPSSASPHHDAEPSGGLVGTGLSGSTMALLEIAKVAQDKGARHIDLELVRLAAIAVFVEHGHHTAHEVLSSAEMWAAHTHSSNKLTYDNSYRRYRSIAPLTERELRGIGKSSRFPDELMGEVTSAAMRHPVPAAYAAPRYSAQSVPIAYRANETGYAGLRR